MMCFLEEPFDLEQHSSLATLTKSVVFILRFFRNVLASARQVVSGVLGLH